MSCTTEANDKLIMTMLPHGIRWAKRHARYWGDEDEFTSIAQLAIVEACRAYKGDCGASLKTCCYRKVITEFRKECGHRSTVRAQDMSRIAMSLNMPPITDMFPDRLRGFAEKYLVEKWTLRQIEQGLRIPRTVVADMRKEVLDILTETYYAVNDCSTAAAD